MIRFEKNFVKLILNKDKETFCIELLAATSIPNPLRGFAKRTELQMFGIIGVNIRMPCRSDVV